jgi:sigma-B regulation protein RsbU (phosphoserine phosphatase)
MRESVVILGLRSVLCVPLALKNNLLGVIYVDNRLQAGIFTQSDLELLSAIASNAAIAIENARLYQLAVEKGRLERELQMAREVQASLLPVDILQIEGWDLAARWLPARQVSGDFYDFLASDSGNPGLVIADVSDKGMPAALFMGLTRTILRASMGPAPTPVEGIARANRLICADSVNSMFVTLFYVQVNPTLAEITYVNAGHNPPLLVTQGEGQAEPETRWLGKTGMALGVLPDTPFSQETIRMAAGDYLVMYTDGVSDAESPTGKPFGMARLQATIQNHHHESAARQVQALEAALETHVGGLDPFDDITILILKRNQ